MAPGGDSKHEDTKSTVMVLHPLLKSGHHLILSLFNSNFRGPCDLLVFMSECIQFCVFLGSLSSSRFLSHAQMHCNSDMFTLTCYRDCRHVGHVVIKLFVTVTRIGSLIVL